MSMQTGSTHTVAINQKGKVYAWGWNDNGQCAKNINEHNEVDVKQSAKSALVFLADADIGAETRIKQIIACKDRTIILT